MSQLPDKQRIDIDVWGPSTTDERSQDELDKEDIDILIELVDSTMKMSRSNKR